MKIYFIALFLCIGHQLYAQAIDVTQFGAKPNSFADATASVKKAIGATKGQAKSVLNFPKGRYDFWPDSATETHYYISNTSSEEEFPVKNKALAYT